MRFFNYLNEEYLDLVLDPMMGKMTTELYVNPSKDEVRKLPEWLRFLADIDNKKIYVWDGSAVLHRPMEQYLYANKFIPTKILGVNYVRGLAKNVNGVLACRDIFDYVGEVETEKRREYLVHNTKKLVWLDKYFTTRFENVF